jgi:hypothetical protein
MGTDRTLPKVRRQKSEVRIVFLCGSIGVYRRPSAAKKRFKNGIRSTFLTLEWKCEADPTFPFDQKRTFGSPLPRENPVRPDLFPARVNWVVKN